MNTSRRETCSIIPATLLGSATVSAGEFSPKPIPEPPEYFDDVALSVWRQSIHEVAPAEYLLFAMYCGQYSLFHAAHMDLKRTSLLVKMYKGTPRERIVANPLLDICVQTVKSIRKLRKDLGLPNAKSATGVSI